MKYLVLLIGDGDAKPWSETTEEEQSEVMGRFQAFDVACTSREGVEILAGEALSGPSDTTTIRPRDGRVTITDGPYAEVIEGMGGFYLMEVPDLDVLLDLLRVLPPYDIQVTPTVEVAF